MSPSEDEEVTPPVVGDEEMLEETAILTGATEETSHVHNVDVDEPKRKMESLEIDTENVLHMVISEDEEDDPMNISGDTDDLSDDMEGLLDGTNNPPKAKAASKKKMKNSTPHILSCFCYQHNKIGNTTVFWPSMYEKTKWGIMGPHWFGPPTVLAMLWAASFYFIHHAWTHIGPVTATICVGFATTATYFLLDTAFRDPGIVIPLDTEATSSEQRPPPPGRHYRWCDLCQAYQPPTGAHCPDCNVCVSGFDHHCAWMGCCIGEGNYKQFMKFNMTWLVFLSYSVFWVSLLGPIIFRNYHHSKEEEQQQVTTLESDGEMVEEIGGQRYFS